MKKQTITEEMKVHEEWYKEAESMKLEGLQGFINHLLDDYNHDYGTICHALTTGAIGTLNAMNNHPSGGITGFQASCIMWGFIRHWMCCEGSMKLLRYDDMLFPQYDYKFEKTISKDIWQDLQKKAADNLQKSGNDTHSEVTGHWQKIVDGVVPFGYMVEEEHTK